MKKIAALLTACCLCAGVAYSQGSTLPLARKSASPVGAHAGAGAKDKYRHARSIYDRLVKARGDQRFPVPKFVFSRSSDQIAWMNNDSLEIGLEEKGYDVCSRYPNPDAALAFLLAHELTHYYEKHNWRRNFARSLRNLKTDIRLDSLEEDVVLETQADYLGGFLSYSAGFGRFEHPDSLLADLYTDYGLEEKLEGYPSLKDRMELCRNTAQKLDRLTDAFELANLLAVTGHYADARQYYRYVLRDFQSPEMYNNIGVTAMMEAIRYLPPGQLKGIYPMEIDLRSRGARDAGSSDTAGILLREAVRHFNFALSMNPDYAPAYLNMACAYSLLRQPERAQFYAAIEGMEAAHKTGESKVESDLQVLLGIVARQRGDDAGAQRIFEKEAASNPVAAENLAILLGKKAPATEVLPMPSEEIDGISLPVFAETKKYDPQLKTEIEANTTFYQNTKTGPHSRIFFSHSHSDDRFTFFHLTQPGYNGETAGGIRLGAAESELMAIYGAPIKTFETPNGRLLVYKNLIFVFDRLGKLTQWVTCYEK